MEFIINDPNTLDQPPADAHLNDLRTKVDSNRKRLRVVLELLPLQHRPDIGLSLTGSAWNEIASASLIEPVGWQLEQTLPICKTALTIGKYILTAGFFYPDFCDVDQRFLDSGKSCFSLIK